VIAASALAPHERDSSDVAALDVIGLLPGDGTPVWTDPLALVVPAGARFILFTDTARSAALFRLVAGMIDPGAGSLRVFGADPAGLTRHDMQRYRRSLGIGLLPHGLLSNLTLRLNVIVPLVYAGILDNVSAGERASEVLDACGILAQADRRPADVPPDIRQRAVIARAIARRPRLLLLDDPVWGVDREGAEQLVDICTAWSETILLATHRPDAILGAAATHEADWTEDGPPVIRAGTG